MQGGELLALLGPNGAGKTTTVRMLGAILRPTTGTARVNGFDVVREADNVRHAIGMLTEQPGLYLRMTGLEYLLFYGRLYGMNDAFTEKRGQDTSSNASTWLAPIPAAWANTPKGCGKRWA